jgi:hypothetical protein
MKLNVGSWIPYLVLIAGVIVLASSASVNRKTPLKNPVMLRSAGFEGVQAGYFQAIDVYKLDVAKKLTENDLLMFVFKSDLERESKSGNSYYINLVNDLEQRNNDLENRIDAYVGKDAAGWINFKDAFDDDLEALRFAFRGLSVRKSS